MTRQSPPIVPERGVPLTAETVVVPKHALEQIAFNLCSLHDFDPSFVQKNEKFALAAITEYLRAQPSASPAREATAFAMNDGMTTHPTLRSANIARQNEWDQDNQISAAYRGNELAGEVGEACNVIKKLERERLGILGSRATVGELADELADVLICADLIAMHYGIDLEAAVARKFNATSEKVGLQTRLAAPTDGGEA